MQWTLIGAAERHTIARRRAEGLVAYPTLGRLRPWPPRSALPTGLRRDIRAFFGRYADGCRRADDLLFRAGDAGAVDDACRRSAVGKLLPKALDVHIGGYRTGIDAGSGSSPARGMPMETTSGILARVPQARSPGRFRG